MKIFRESARGNSKSTSPPIVSQCSLSRFNQALPYYLRPSGPGSGRLVVRVVVPKRKVVAKEQLTFLRGMHPGSHRHNLASLEVLISV